MIDLDTRCQEILTRAREGAGSVASPAELQQLRASFLGKKGAVTELLQGMRDLAPAERPVAGQRVNALKAELEALFDQRRRDVEAATLRARAGGPVDLTLPGRGRFRGHLHPITRTARDMAQVFGGMGFTLAAGPQVEDEWFNFDALNIPRTHPARDLQDTFYVTDDVVLRTHTSPVQIRAMRAAKPPLRVICPGPVYRCDWDQTHSPMFHQVEGLWVDENVTFADLKGVIETFIGEMFGKGTKLRFRPSYFPFTEPSAEVDMWFGGRWLEVLGCGMVNPKVFAALGDPAYDPERVQGFAFGMGIERFAMVRYGIDDLRLFYENDVRFLEQF
ncbi:phenylalanine--tRNA ligase subunit alpha [Myxococcota bacterium]|nr:phenylalanine--tRNA ligase subunit alpha [Myxococcota bacterium]